MKSLIQELKEKFDEGVEKPPVKSNNKKLIKEEYNSLKLMMEEKLAAEPQLRSSPPSENLFSPVEQLQGEIQDKDKIIEGLTIGLTKLKNQISIAEKEKSDILEGLKKSKWLESKVALVSKKLYEDKIKSIINENADSKLIPVLTTAARRKQGNQQLNWDGWLKIPENGYLFQVNEDIAKKIFENTNALIGKRIVEAQGAGGTPRGSLTFTGNTSGDSEYVSTNFNPDDYNLNLGCTISYWVRPDEVGQTMFAFGRKYSNSERFTFGINKNTQVYIGLGSNKLTNSWTAMGVDSSLLDGTVLRTDGTWYHFAVTYDERSDVSSGTDRKLYLNGTLIKTANINWNNTGGSFTNDGMYFGGRNLRSGSNPSYNNGWACGLDEVAIFDTVKNVSTLYNDGIPSDLSDESGLVGYWKFNEGSGITVKDYSGNGNHGTFASDILPTWSTDTP